jgi:tricorn protease
MSRSILRPSAVLSALALLTLPVGSLPAQSGTRLLRTPSVSAQHIVFAYANNIWAVERRGGAAKEPAPPVWGKRKP